MNSFFENTNFEKIKTIYLEVLGVTLKMAELIDSGDLEDLPLYIEKKGILVKDANDIRNTYAFSTVEKHELNEIISKIKETEDSNLNKMEAVKQKYSNELRVLNQNSRILAAYKVDKENTPGFLDIKE